MTSNTVSAREAARPDFGATHKFPHVFQAEIDLINERRQGDPRGKIKLEHEAKDVSGEWVWRPPENASLTGLALSGGGIRSAAFCLGVLQALNRTKVLDRVDYLSTVSGGGYIGCSLTAALEWSGQHGGPEFPFTSRLEEDEPPALQHIRDYSNYLFPDGASDLLHNASIYARGLAVNFVLVAPFVLVASVFTLLWYSVRDYQSDLITWVTSILNPFRLPHFFITVDLALVLIVVNIFWGIYQSTMARQNKPEIPHGWTGGIGVLVLVVFVALFCELQPFVLDAMRKAGTGNLYALLPKWISTISTALAPIATVMAFLASKLGEIVKSAAESPKLRTQLMGLAVQAAIYIAGLVVPILIWVAYLEITYFGLSDWSALSVTLVYFSAAAVFAVLSLLMRPNANSLHPLYRDRLGKAFLFRPRQTPLGPGDHLVEEWRPSFSELTGLKGPYHLINTALNVEASKVANRRGRNADFFIFSKLFVGSKSTDYVATSDMEDVAVGLDLPTAMAASGAAVSSNMGAQSIKPLTPTLALLNIRLGYWLRNPQWLARARPPESNAPTSRMSEFRRRHNLLANYYFVAEMFGLLSDRFKSIYLTDGGHIENLGVYELLRRRCRVIIAVDAEADPQMAFASFNTLERYALIDMGIRIDLPWEQVAKESLATGKAIDETGDAPKHPGPHCAIGEISYPGNRKGVLVYIKASLTGDENDYIFNYKTRYDAFPHETTLDQWFTEEQFEAYRALGFHAAYRLFDRSDEFAHLDPEKNLNVRPQIDLLDQLFPRVLTRDPPPGQKQTFAAWLPAELPNPPSAP